MKKVLITIAFLVIGFTIYAQSPTSPVKEIEIAGRLKPSKTESHDDPSNNSTTHKFTCEVVPNEICLRINKPNLPIGGTGTYNELPNGVIEVGTYISITAPLLNPLNPYTGYFIDYTYSVGETDLMDRVHTIRVSH